MNVIKPYLPTGPYRVKAPTEFSPTGYGSVRLGVSLGGMNHEGDRFSALLEWANASFDETHVFIADSLQRHNIMFSAGCSASVAEKAALTAGDIWLLKHESFLSSSKISKVYRWNELLHLKGVAETLDLLKFLYTEDAVFSALIDSDIKSAWLRKVKQGIFTLETHFDGYMKHSTNYVLEELAVMNHMGSLFPGVEVYPGNHLRILTAQQRFLIEKLPSALKHYPLIEVTYRRNKAAIQAGSAAE